MKTVKENQANTAKTEGKWLRDSETKFHDLPIHRQVRRLIVAFQDRGCKPQDARSLRYFGCKTLRAETSPVRGMYAEVHLCTDEAANTKTRGNHYEREETKICCLLPGKHEQTI